MTPRPSSAFAPRLFALFLAVSLAACSSSDPKALTGPAGPEGPRGPAGATGPAGPAGVAGPSGLSIVAATSPEAPGAHCATGGVKLDLGLDQNGNGTLDTAEVDPSRTQYLCGGPAGATGPAGLTGPAGATGASGLTTLATTSPEAAGANCATGGIKIELGLDQDGNGTLETGEVNAASTRYVCNGAQGPQGSPGATGPAGAPGAAGAAGAAGATGPQGPAGTLGIYGDGSAGALSVPSGNTLDLSTPAGFADLPAGANLQFTSIDISGTLKVPSGTVLRATGNVTLSGNLTVLPGASDNGAFEPQEGVALAPANQPYGGTGLAKLQGARLLNPGLRGGGAGARSASSSGGLGGGSLTLLAQGNISVTSSGTISADGTNGVSPVTGIDSLGAGGGAGGVIALVAKGTLSVAGGIFANGGNGSNGNNGNGGAGAGGGGGGGGGIVHLVASSTPSVGGATIQVNGGSAGTNGAPTSGTSISGGGGGGACGGNGGNGGLVNGATATTVTPSAGGAGYVISTVSPSPENLFF